MTYLPLTQAFSVLTGVALFVVAMTSNYSTKLTVLFFVLLALHILISIFIFSNNLIP